MNPKINETITRRRALGQLALLPLEFSGLSALGAVLSSPVEEIVTRCAGGIVACAHLSMGTNQDMSLAWSALSAYLPTLKEIVKEYPSHRKAAAQLMARGLNLLAILAVHREGSKQAIGYAQQAVTYSKESSDPPLQLRILQALSWMYACNKQEQRAVEAILQAQHLMEHATLPIPALLESKIYAGVAQCQAQSGQGAEGLVALRRSQEAFPDTLSREDLVYAIDIGFDQSDLLMVDGLTHYYMEEYEQALEAFAQVVDPETLSSKIPPSSQRIYVEIVNHQALASLKLPPARRDRALSLHLWKAGIEGARTLQSEQRLSEALMAYEIMKALWPHDAEIKELRDWLKHW